MAWKDDKCTRCGCKQKDWCYPLDSDVWTVGCERRAAVFRIWLEPVGDFTKDEYERMIEESCRIAERLRPGISGEPIAIAEDGEHDS